MNLFERINGIEELAYTLESDLMFEEEKIPEKMAVEKEKALRNMQQWWNDMYEIPI